jgi:hypothetical protein
MQGTGIVEGKIISRESGKGGIRQLTFFELAREQLPEVLVRQAGIPTLKG